jgi:tetratricopeptide (TPR) repeat protein
MSLKYRIRVSADRVIGPFSKEEVIELYQKNHISGTEDCQLFPVGPWTNIRLIQSLEDIFQVQSSATSTELVSSETKSFQKKQYKEFKFGKDEINEVDYEAIKKKLDEKDKLNHVQLEDVGPTEPELEKTVIHNRQQVEDLEKTRINFQRASIPIKRDPVEIEQDHASEENERLNIEKEIQQSIKDQINEKTQMFDLNSILPSINTEVRVAEVDFSMKEKVEETADRAMYKKLEEERLEKLARQNAIEKAKYEEAEKKKKKRGMTPIVAFAFAAILYVLLNPDDAPVSKDPIYAPINFPITLEYEDATKAKISFQRGKEAYALGNYQGRLMAAQSFMDSVQNQFKANEALSDLILTYSEILENAKDEKLASNVLYKLILLSENKSFSDVKIVMGSALFYYKIGKFQTGINLIKNYFRAKGKATSKLLAYYLDLLVAAGDFTEAAKIAAKLNDIEPKPYEAYLSLSKYYDSDEKLDLGEKTIYQGLKIYPQSVPLILRQADYFLKKSELEQFAVTLLKCSKLGSERAPAYLAKYYMQVGFLNAAKNNTKEASAYFKKSLQLSESDDLRATLANLEIQGDKFSQKLILESKIIELMKRAEAEIKNKNYTAASTFSVEAVDADPDYVPAIVQHVRIQLNQGLYDAALFTLNRVLEKQAQNNQIKKMLVETYIKALKLEDAQKMLLELFKTKYSFTATYATLMAKTFEAKNNSPLALRWYSEALNRNPLSDNDMFSLARLYFKLKKFDEAKKQLSKALTLDPKNIDYIALQAEIYFDQDGADVALGYLRDIIADLGEDPLLISTIAKFYYKSGQIKEFQTYYKKILSMNKKDANFFEFLIFTAKLEDNKTDFINYSKELIKVNPGNLALQMEIAEFYIRQKNYQEAQVYLTQIDDKLKSYPRLYFLMAKIAIMQGDFTKAKEMADKEKSNNPTLESSFIIEGEVAMAQKDYREAVVMYEKAISINPKSVDALLAIGGIKLGQNHSSEALDLLMLAYKYDKNNPEVSKQLGFAYKAAGQRSLGRERLEDYLKLNPGAQDREAIEAVIKALK